MVQSIVAARVSRRLAQMAHVHSWLSVTLVSIRDGERLGVCILSHATISNIIRKMTC